MRRSINITYLSHVEAGQHALVLRHHLAAVLVVEHLHHDLLQKHHVPQVRLPHVLQNHVSAEQTGLVLFRFQQWSVRVGVVRHVAPRGRFPTLQRALGIKRVCRCVVVIVDVLVRELVGRDGHLTVAAVRVVGPLPAEAAAFVASLVVPSPQVGHCGPSGKWSRGIWKMNGSTVARRLLL